MSVAFTLYRPGTDLVPVERIHPRFHEASVEILRILVDDLEYGPAIIPVEYRLIMRTITAGGETVVSDIHHTLTDMMVVVASAALHRHPRAQRITGHRG